METQLKSFRFVIQQCETRPVPSYRIVVYRGSNAHYHFDFGSAQILIEALRAAIPDFDISRLSLNPLSDGHGSIVFADELNLNHLQLTVLQLNR